MSLIMGQALTSTNLNMESKTNKYLKNKQVHGQRASEPTDKLSPNIYKPQYRI